MILAEKIERKVYVKHDDFVSHIYNLRHGTDEYYIYEYYRCMFQCCISYLFHNFTRDFGSALIVDIDWKRLSYVVGLN